MKVTITFLAWIVGGYLHDQGGYPFTGYMLIFIATTEFFRETWWLPRQRRREESSG